MDVDGSTNFLSLFLRLSDTLPQNHGMLLKFRLSIKDQENGKHKEIQGSHSIETSQCSKTSIIIPLPSVLCSFVGNVGRCELSMKAMGCGRGRFILMKDLKDTSKGYIVKGKCCIEVEVSVIGVSTIAD
jgi:hypothetical protein